MKHAIIVDNKEVGVILAALRSDYFKWFDRANSGEWEPEPCMNRARECANLIRDIERGYAK